MFAAVMPLRVDESLLLDLVERERHFLPRPSTHDLVVHLFRNADF